MKPLPRPESTAPILNVRPASPADRDAISSLMFSASHVHRHLDWRTPLDWLEARPYWLIDDGGPVSGVLACPPDPDSIAWLRLFASDALLGAREAWSALWPPARAELSALGGATAAAIATHAWLEPVLGGAGFAQVGHIVLLEWRDGPRPSLDMPPGFEIEPLTALNLPEAVEVDAAAFDPLWRNSMDALTRALAQAVCATVARDASGIVGYQLSTGGSFGMHLARLAVRPDAQRHGVGRALIADLIARLPADVEQRISVNTQSDNAASLSLYQHLGFRRTGQRFPVFSHVVR
jgi:ribosomal protein S18 acetylase RimI-like enzyme